MTALKHTVAKLTEQECWAIFRECAAAMRRIEAAPKRAVWLKEKTA